MGIRHCRLVCLAAALLIAPACALAEMRALLVAVSGYPSLGSEYQLKGPRNDVVRFQQVLLQRGLKSQNLVMLADGVEGAAAPTRANIMTALDTLAKSSGAGDTVVLYFAGHGSQQPADRKTPEGRQEPDGLHEIFLPVDVGRWDGKAGTVGNAIIDHELRSRVDQIQSHGAFVWGIFDACHSATMVRGGSADEIRFRHVSPLALGIDQRTLDAAQTGAARTRGGPVTDSKLPGFMLATVPSGPGGAAFFYAAQTTELAPEMPLPQGDAQRQPYGLFSFMVTRALELGQPLTYRQLAQYVLSQYAGMAEARVTPIFSGSALDQIVLGQQTVAIRQWPVSADALRLPTGSLSGLGEGAVFALVASPLAKTEDAMGYLRAKKVEINQTELEPVAMQGKDAPKSADFVAGSQARLLSNPVRFSLRVALDYRACKAPCIWQPALDQLQKAVVPGADVSWVVSGADIVLKPTTDAVLVLAPSEQGERLCSGLARCSGVRGTTLLARRAQQASMRDEDVTRLAQALHTVARSTNLLRLASQMGLPAAGKGVIVTMQFRRAGRGAALPITRDSVPALLPDDVVSVTIENQGVRAQDVTLLYADARFGIGVLFPSGEGEVNRLEPGAKIAIDDVKINDKDGVFGIERMLIISVEAARHSDRADFSFLSQPSLMDALEVATRGGATRGADSSDTIQAFVDAGFADYATRGMPARAPGNRTAMQVFTFDVKPGQTGRRP